MLNFTTGMYNIVHVCVEFVQFVRISGIICLFSQFLNIFL